MCKAAVTTKCDRPWAEYKKLKKATKWKIHNDMRSFVNESILKHGVRKMTRTKDTTNSIPFSPTQINEHFAAISNKPLGEEKPIPTMQVNSDRYTLDRITKSELCYAWSKMNQKENKSEDGMGMCNLMFNKLLKIHDCCLAILHVMNLTITTNIVPQKLKIIKIVPIPNNTWAQCRNGRNPYNE